ncbi:MFS transporter [Bhargavaea ullalensis]|uniref:MFS family permease n=1 Tax=Bhargavaea ullalensis TaxID=1265685 RepID=A0ABV2G8D1_9BACL
MPFTMTSGMFLSGILTPLLTSRFRLNRLLAASQIMKAIFTTGFAAILPFINPGNYWLIFIAILLTALCDGFANPISQALIPHYVEADQLVKANGIFEGVYQTINTGVWLAGGRFLLFLNSGQLIWVVAALSLFSSLLLCLLEGTATGTEEDRQQGLHPIKDGWHTLFRTPVLKKIARVELLETIGGTVWIAAILYVYVEEVLNTGRQWWGFINGLFFCGLILGGLLFVRFDRFADRHLPKLIITGLFGGAAATALFGLNSSPMAALLLSLIVGLAGQMVAIPKQTLIQTSVPESRLANVYASLGVLGTAVFGIASLLIGITVDWLGVRAVFLISSAALLAAAVLVFSSRKIFVRSTP